MSPAAGFSISSELKLSVAESSWFMGLGFTGFRVYRF